MFLKTLLTLFFLMAGLSGYSQQISKSTVSIGLFADIQYYDGPNAGTRHYRASLDKIPGMIKHLNLESLDFIVDLGDRIDKNFESFKAIEDLLDKSRHPIVFVPGNHDYSVKPLQKKAVTAKSGNRKGYHSRTINNYRIIFLNGFVNSVIAHSPISPNYWKAAHELKSLKKNNAANAYDWNGGLGGTQARWLTSQLKSAKEEKLNVVIFCHQPISPGNPHNLWNADKVLAELANYPHEVWWISGHDHRGGFHEYKNLHLLTLHGMVEGDEQSYAILQLRKDQVFLSGFGNQDNLNELRSKQ